MKRSELMKRLQELFGDEDVEVYLYTTEIGYEDEMLVLIDDGDAVIRPDNL